MFKATTKPAKIRAIYFALITLTGCNSSFSNPLGSFTQYLSSSGNSQSGSVSATPTAVPSHAAATIAPPVIQGEDLVADGFHLVFDDEFNAVSYSQDGYADGTQWTNHWYCPGGNNSANLKLDKGVLNFIQQSQEPSNPGAWDSAAINTMDMCQWVNGYPGFTQQFGYFEARIKTARGDGLVNTWWGMSIGHYDHLGDPSYYASEFDVLEQPGQQSFAAYQTLHRDTATDLDENEGDIAYPNVDMTRDYHTYGLLWKQGSTTISFYVDGVPWSSPTKYDSTDSSAIFLTLSLDVNSWAGYADGFTPNPSTMQVDWVRIWSQNPNQPAIQVSPAPIPFDGPTTRNAYDWTAGNSADAVSSSETIANPTWSQGNGNWYKFANMTFDQFRSDDAAGQITINYGSPYSDASIGVYIDSPTGTLVGTVPIASTGSSATVRPTTVFLNQGVSGKHDVYLVPIAGAAETAGTSIANVQSFQFLHARPADATYSVAAADVTSLGGVYATATFVGVYRGWYKLNFGSAGMTSFTANIGNGPVTTGQTLDLHIDSLNGPLVGQLQLEPETGPDDFHQNTMLLQQPITGVHDIYLVLSNTGTQTINGQMMNMNFNNAPITVMSGAEFNQMLGTTVAPNGLIAFLAANQTTAVPSTPIPGTIPTFLINQTFHVFAGSPNSQLLGDMAIGDGIVSYNPYTGPPSIMSSVGSNSIIYLMPDGLLGQRSSLGQQSIIEIIN